MGFSGLSFTWMKGLSENTFSRAQLDRALVNIEWRELFPDATVTHLPKLQFDHVPLLLTLSYVDDRPRIASFKFQAAWTKHQSFKGLIQKTSVNDFVDT